MLFGYFAAVVAASAHCRPIEVTVVRKDMPPAFSAKLVQRTSTNFAIAYSNACKEHLLRKPLIDPRAKNKAHLFLFNAPNANVASIYEISGRMLLEYSFVSEDGQTQVPSLEELHEAIYCAAHGVSKKEREESGRCLPD